MHIASFFPLGVILFVFGLVFFLIGFYYFRRKQLIENIPTSKIRSLAMGLVEIYGEVVPWKETLKSPLENKDCVYFHYTVQKHERHYNSSSKRWEDRWVTVQNTKQSVPFSLKDETGVVLIEPKEATIEIRKDATREAGDMRYQEWIIKSKDMLYILGTAGENPDTQSTLTTQSVDHIMIQKGKREKMYYISDKSEREILKSFSRRSSVSIIIGSIFIVIGCVIILLYLGVV